MLGADQGDGPVSVIPDSINTTMTGATDAAPLSLTYHDERGKFAGIAFRNAVFGLLTLGTYRFWGKTRIRRHLWSHVSLAGEPFEYTGLAKELLFGFLIVLAFLVPFSAASQFADLALVTIGTWAVVAKNVAFGALIYWLLNLAIYRARRYRLTRTLWRGIRGAQTGSAIGYAFKAFGYGLLTLVTLGLAYPLMRTGLYRIRMRNTWIGNTRFRFEGSAGPLFKRWLVAWLPVTVTIAVYVGLIIAANTIEAPGDAAVDDRFMVETMGGGGLLLLIMVPVSTVLYVWYRASEFRYFAGQTCFEGLRFASELKARSLIWIYLSFWLAMFGVLLVIGMAVGGVVAYLGFQGIAAAGANWQPDPFVAFLIGLPVVLVFLLVNSVLQVILVLRRLVMRICGSLTCCRISFIYMALWIMVYPGPSSVPILAGSQSRA